MDRGADRLVQDWFGFCDGAEILFLFGNNPHLLFWRVESVYGGLSFHITGRTELFSCGGRATSGGGRAA